MFFFILARVYQSAGLQKKYAEDPTFTLQVKQLFALAFLPVHMM